MNFAIVGFLVSIYMFVFFESERDDVEKWLSNVGYCAIVGWFVACIFMSIRSVLKKHLYATRVLISVVVLALLPVGVALIAVLLSLGPAHI